jgi:hypothetical protein
MRVFEREVVGSEAPVSEVGQIGARASEKLDSQPNGWHSCDTSNRAWAAIASHLRGAGERVRQSDRVSSNHSARSF